LKIIKEKKDVTIGCDSDRNLANDDMKVFFENNVLIEMSKKLDKYDSGYIGLTVVDKSLISDYFDCADMTLKKKGESAVVENILLELSNKGVNIHKCDLSNFRWFEIDTPALPVFPPVIPQSPSCFFHILLCLSILHQSSFPAACVLSLSLYYSEHTIH